MISYFKSNEKDQAKVSQAEDSNVNEPSMFDCNF